MKNKIVKSLLFIMGSISLAHPLYSTDKGTANGQEKNMIKIDSKEGMPCCQGHEVAKEGLSTLTKTINPDILKEITGILSQRFDAKIQIKSVVQLSEPERRNLILRITIQNPKKGVPSQFIFKQTLLEKSSKDDKEALERFSRDWAGLV